MKYIDSDRIATGTVWSPGPLPHSVWVLPTDGGSPVVVKVPNGATDRAHRVDYTLPTLIDAYGDLVWHHPDRGTRWTHGATVRTWTYRHAPKLSARTWQACLTD